MEDSRKECASGAGTGEEVTRPDQVEVEGDAVFDGGRNWTAVATEALVRSWRKVSLEGRAADEKSAHVFQRIFEEYQRRVPNTKRTTKAVEANSLGQAYRFIADFNAHRDKRHAEMLVVFRELINAYKSK
ncbi:hypothetical protein P43SY_011325 [Pythium insidiosum]|uniref:Uncharacterized protein n=1 Tax=Pythium insidiosum TaxID=114742 RepID=A0AAD5L6V2_PYTIN|nr:hypothetical protein P43SY_011325 [Pythium insidiosum]